MHQLGSVTTVQQGKLATSMAKCRCGIYLITVEATQDEAEQAMDEKFEAHKKESK